MTSRCPSDVALEQHLAHPHGSALTAHLGGCARCAARLEEMRQQGEVFARDVFPRTVDAVTAAATPWHLPRWQWGLSLLPVAATAALVLWLAPAGPDATYVGAKGGPLMLAAYVAAADGPRALADGEAIPAGSSLRFTVRTDTPCTLVLVSVDDTGQISELYVGPQALTVDTGETTLPGGVTLDGRPGRERFVAICTATPVDVDRLRAALKRAVHDRPRPASEWQAPSDLPEPARHTSLVVEKR